MHMKTEHEVVKYRMDLVVALSTLATWEERRMVEVGKQRLASLEMSGQCQKGGLFLEEGVSSQKKRDLAKDDKEGMRMELEEIRKLLLDNSDDQDGDIVEKTSTDTEDVEIIEVIENCPKEPRNAIFERRIKVEECPETPPPSLPPTPSQDPEEIEIEILEIIEKHPKLNQTNIWSDRKVKLEEKTPPPSAPPTPRSSPVSEVAREYSIKMEPEIEMVVDGAAETEGLDENAEEEVEGEGGVDQSLPFCRLCYITFTDHTDQLPHEQQVGFFVFFFYILEKIVHRLFRCIAPSRTGRR